MDRDDFITAFLGAFGLMFVLWTFDLSWWVQLGALLMWWSLAGLIADREE